MSVEHLGSAPGSASDAIATAIAGFRAQLLSDAPLENVFLHLIAWLTTCEDAARAEVPLGREDARVKDSVVASSLSSVLGRSVNVRRSCWVSLEGHRLTHGTFRVGLREGTAFFVEDMGVVVLGGLTGHDPVVVKVRLVPAGHCEACAARLDAAD